MRTILAGADMAQFNVVWCRSADLAWCGADLVHCSVNVSSEHNASAECTEKSPFNHLKNGLAAAPHPYCAIPYVPVGTDKLGT